MKSQFAIAPAADHGCHCSAVVASLEFLWLVRGSGLLIEWCDGVWAVSRFTPRRHAGQRISRKYASRCWEPGDASAMAVGRTRSVFAMAGLSKKKLMVS